MFEYDHTGNLVFLHGKTAYEKAQNGASLCEYFHLDPDEDECITSTHISSCYNCLFRRWTHQSFICMKKSRYEKKL